MTIENLFLFMFIVAMTVGVVTFGVIHWIRMSTIKKVQDNNLSEVVGQVNSNFVVIAENEKQQEGILTGLKSSVSSLGTGLTGTDSKLANLDGSLNKVATELEAVKGSTSLMGTSLEKEVKGIRGGLGVVEGEYSDLGGKFSTMQSAFGMLGIDLRAMATKLGLIRSDVNVVMDETSSLSSKIGSINTQMTGLNTRMGTLDASVTEMGGSMSTLGSKVTNATSSVDSLVKADATMNNKLSELSTQVGTMASAGSDLKTEVTNLGTKVTGIDTSMATMGSSLTGLTTEVGNLKTTWQSQFNTLTAKVGAAATAATTAATAAATASGADVNATNVTAKNMVHANRSSTDKWPAGWAAGAHAQNVYANDKIGVGTNGAVSSWFDNKGVGYVGKSLNLKGGASAHNSGGWGTHFPWEGDNKNYIRGDTELRGNNNNIGDLTVGGILNTTGYGYFKGGTSVHNPGKWQTHFPWAGDQKNYIRGDTEIRGNTNNLGDITVGGTLRANNQFCIRGTCIDQNRLERIISRTR